MKILVAIPTYGRPIYIEELLNECASVFIENGSHIIIYDSSVDEETEKIVKNYIHKFNGLYYVRMNSEIRSNRKFIMIMRGYEWKDNYDYVWLWGDSLRFYEGSLKKVLRCIDDNADLIITDIMDREHLTTVLYTDKQSLFEDYAWYMTLYGAVVIRTESILSKIKWEVIDEKYMTEDTYYYCQIGMYFEVLSEMNSFKAYHVSIDSNEGHARIRMRENEKGGWYKDRVDVMCKNWVNTVLRLPDTYRNKKIVIKKYGVYSDAFSNRSIVMLKKGGYYNFQKFQKYRKVWPLITDTSIVWLFMVAVMPRAIIGIVFNALVIIKGFLRKSVAERIVEEQDVFC